jgi:hypothetical protein
MIQIVIALLLLAAGFFLSDYGDITAVLMQTVGMLLLLHGLPKYTNAIVIKIYPRFGALVKGDEPYNEMSSLPKRVIVVGAYALCLVSLGLVGVVGVYFLITAIK